MRALYAVTHHTSAQNFLRGQLDFMSSHGIDVHLACSPGPGLREIDKTDHPTIHEIQTSRDIDPLSDVRSLVAYFRLVRRLRPEAVHGSTPKAALLSLFAAKMLRVKTRVYLVRGLRLETVVGFKRSVLSYMERVTCWAATDVTAVSPSLRNQILAARLNAGREVTVLGSGSSNGVDAQFFKPSSALRAKARKGLGLNANDVVVTFIGRVNRDKGADVFLEMVQHFSGETGLRFLVQGEVEDRGIIEEQAHALRSAIHLPWGNTKNTLAASDLLVLPTRREGFPNVVLEAACMEIPTITTTATGARDSVINGVTGLLFHAGDVQALVESVRILVDDAVMRRRCGLAARQRAVLDFNQESLWTDIKALLTSRASPGISSPELVPPEGNCGSRRQG